MNSASLQYQRQQEGKMRHPGVLSTIRQLRSDKSDFALRNKDLASANKRLKEELERIVKDAKMRAKQYEDSTSEMQEQFVSVLMGGASSQRRGLPSAFHLTRLLVNALSPLYPATFSSISTPTELSSGQIETG